MFLNFSVGGKNGAGPSGPPSVTVLNLEFGFPVWILDESVTFSFLHAILPKLHHRPSLLLSLSLFLFLLCISVSLDLEIKVSSFHVRIRHFQSQHVAPESQSVVSGP